MPLENPNLVDSMDDFGDHSSHFSEEIRPNLINETSTDLKLNLLANQMKITFHDESENQERPEAETLKRSASSQSLSVSTDNNSQDNYHPRYSVLQPQHPQPKTAPIMDPNNQRMRKIELLRIFQELEGRGIVMSTKYNINSNLEEMEQEYEILKSIQTKKNGVKLYKGFLLNSIQAIEFMNETYNPFDFHLKGWSEHFGAGVDDYEDVLGELYEKYKSTGKKMEPELKLLLMLCASATTFHASSTYLKNIPGLDDMVKKNPKLVNNLTKNMVKDPTPVDDTPPEFRPQSQMKGPNPREFLNRMREEQQRMKPPPSFNDNITESVSELTSTTRKKKKKGVTLDI